MRYRADFVGIDVNPSEAANLFQISFDPFGREIERLEVCFIACNNETALPGFSIFDDRFELIEEVDAVTSDLLARMSGENTIARPKGEEGGAENYDSSQEEDGSNRAESESHSR